MNKEIDWFNLPYDHAGTWSKKFDSIMGSTSKITWPQFISEMIIFLRVKVLPNYNDVKLGNDWYKSLMREVRMLNQQASAICNYFPHPDNEPLVIVAFKNFFRKHRPLKIGQFRKTRFTEKNGRKISNITQAEKDVVIGIDDELQRLIKQRDIFINCKSSLSENVGQGEISFKPTQSSSGKSIKSLIELEQTLIK